MTNVLRKEMKLSASILSYLFIAFGLMFFLPGYPVLCGEFFVTLGIFQSFQNAREANDILFSALLPIAKKDIVKGKYLFCCAIEICSLILMAVVALIRMTILSDVKAYRENALMNANLFALSMAFVLFAMFNLIFVRGFFKTGHKFAKPFVTYIIVCFLLIVLAETVHHIPGLEAVNSFGFDNAGLQFGLLICGILLYIVITAFACKRACQLFEKIDL